MATRFETVNELKDKSENENTKNVEWWKNVFEKWTNKRNLISLVSSDSISATSENTRDIQLILNFTRPHVIAYTKLMLQHCPISILGYTIISENKTVNSPIKFEKIVKVMIIRNHTLD